MTTPQWKALRRKLRRAARRIKRVKAMKVKFRVEQGGPMAECKHPPTKLYTWFAYNCVTDKADWLCVVKI